MVIEIFLLSRGVEWVVFPNSITALKTFIAGMLNTRYPYAIGYYILKLGHIPQYIITFYNEKDINIFKEENLETGIPSFTFILGENDSVIKQ